MELKSNVSLPEYMKQGFERKINPNPFEINMHGSVDSGNHSAFFCPSGFVIQSLEKESKEGGLNVKLEEDWHNDYK